MSTAPESLESVFDDAFTSISQTLKNFTPQLALREVGTITKVSTGVVRSQGFPALVSRSW